jgi:hypothetical protein
MKKIIITNLGILVCVLVFKILNNGKNVSDAMRYFVYQNYIREILLGALILIFLLSFFVKSKREKVISILVSGVTLVLVFILVNSIKNISSSGGI